ncbi:MULTISPECIES: beta-eliminating lyase-related protein [unclassified Sphingomonas]|uniref:threonine aldolase family protein n=1 Tax=unclassified Sphingomonas TaxID=196159 RepID=UPI00092BF67E|nr:MULTISPECIES: beta-eliminating lyase-related protein [unclassified Sphingomonas]MBN8847386.1 low specificity L-threonine aldolase [Sphingomonas sp.]OJV32307.1 MAG: low specificity L-threonine aldolase [Sphingomonas sp. 67-36]
MQFFSDNVAPVHPAVFAAMQAADAVDSGYDGDRLSKALDARFSALFGREAVALWVPTGTVANSIALAAICPPYGGVICHHEAHIQNDECGAPEFYTHGAKLLLAGGADAKMTPETAAAVADAIPNDVHRVQPRALSLTNATELGTVYTPDEVRALAALAETRGWRVHMDGARLANAIVHLGCSPADLMHGVDVLSFGFVKNGGLSAEALVFFDPALADDARRRRKRGGHLLSKGRYLAAQIHAMLDGDLWLANARAANAAAARLAQAAAGRLVHPVEANELFLRMTPDEAAALRARGFGFYDWSEGVIRLVTHWASSMDEVDALAAAIAAL